MVWRAVLLGHDMERGTACRCMGLQAYHFLHCTDNGRTTQCAIYNAFTEAFEELRRCPREDGIQRWGRLKEMVDNAPPVTDTLMQYVLMQ